jgi:hypothetical protein
MKYLYYNTTLIASALTSILLIFLRLEHIYSLDWLLLPALLVFTVSLVLKVFRGVKTGRLN